MIKYQITLSDSDITLLQHIISDETSSEREKLHAQILLSSDQSKSDYLTVTKAAEAYNTTSTTVQDVRKTFSERGIESIKRKKRHPAPYKITSNIEKTIFDFISIFKHPLCCSKCSVDMIQDELMKKQNVNLSRATVYRFLKNNNINLDIINKENTAKRSNVDDFLRTGNWNGIIYDISKIENFLITIEPIIQKDWMMGRIAEKIFGNLDTFFIKWEINREKQAIYLYFNCLPTENLCACCKKEVDKQTALKYKWVYKKTNKFFTIHKHKA